MCCFSRRVESVTNTNIFASNSKTPMQFLIYSMNFLAMEDLAMILPIPVPIGTAEKGVRFINLEKYPDFFVGMESGFPKPKPSAVTAAPPRAGEKPPKLEVVEVGAFDASFVPTINDFARLDERFRLPAGTWEKLPQYKKYGFAVFKLKQGRHKAHPMAFEFPRADPRRLFFPTVHIHDGLVHETADFDHALYAQFDMDYHHEAEVWQESPQPAGMFMDISKCAGIVDGNGHVYKQTLRGKRKNADTLA